MNKKKKTLGIVVGVVVIAIVAVLSYNALAGNSKEKAAEKMASVFYESFYYEQVTLGKSESDVKELLEQFKNDGMEITLDTIVKISEVDVEAQVSKLKGCDLEKSSVTIIPALPYTNKDYTVKVNLSC